MLKLLNKICFLKFLISQNFDSIEILLIQKIYIHVHLFQLYFKINVTDVFLKKDFDKILLLSGLLRMSHSIYLIHRVSQKKNRLRDGCPSDKRNFILGRLACLHKRNKILQGSPKSKKEKKH